MLSCCFILSLGKGNHLICVVVLLNIIWICLLGWLMSNLYFYAVLLIFLLEQVFLSPYFQLHLNSYQLWGYLNPLQTVIILITIFIACCLYYKWISQLSDLLGHLLQTVLKRKVWWTIFHTHFGLEIGSSQILRLWLLKHICKLQVIF